MLSLYGADMASRAHFTPSKITVADLCERYARFGCRACICTPSHDEAMRSAQQIASTVNKAIETAYDAMTISACRDDISARLMMLDAAPKPDGLCWQKYASRYATSAPSGATLDAHSASILACAGVWARPCCWHEDDHLCTGALF